MKSSKKILIVCQHYWPENFRLNDIAQFFIEKGNKVDVLCGIPNYPKGKFFDGYGVFKKRKQEIDGVKIRRVFEIPRGNNSNIRIFINYMSFPIASLFHIPRLYFKKYDKIFLYSLSPVYMSTAGIILGRLTKTQTILYVLDLWPENLYSVLPIRNNLAKRLLKRTSHWHYKNADKLIVLSEQMKQHMINNVGVPYKNIAVIPQTSEKIYEKDIQDKKLKAKYSGGFNIVYAGNISPAQSFRTMIEAAKILKEEGLDDIRWIILGDGMSANNVKAEVKKKNLSKSFIFEGMKPIEDIPRYNPIADVLVGCLTKSKLLEATVPAKVMSYIASGRPIVLAMDGEVKDLVEDKIKCGYVGPTEDAQELAKNIRKLYDMPSKKRDELGKNARKYHFANLERNVVLKKVYDFLFV